MTADDQRPHRGLQLRLLGVFVAGALPVVLIAGLVAYQVGQHRSEGETRRTLEDLIVAVEKTVQIGTYSNDPVLLREVVGGLVRHPRLQRAVVRRADGVALVDLSRDDRPQAAAPAVGMQVSRRVMSPFDPAEVIGLIELSPDLKAQQRSARQEAERLALALMAQTLLVALLLYAMVARLVSGPIVRLAMSLRRMAPGTADRLTMPAGHQRDEIGQLVGGANALLQANEQALLRERALRAEIESMEAQYRQIFDSTSAGIFVLTPEGRLINSNPTALRVVGMPLHGLRELRQADFLREVFAWPERVQAMIREAISVRRTVSADLELRQRGKGLQWVHCLISVQCSPGTGEARSTGVPQLVEAVMYDVTERIRVEHDARRQAEHDPLTGLHNRAGFQRRVERLLEEVEAPLLALLYIDLDGFKGVNDELGHAAGDRVLKVCALRMERAVRRGVDAVARLGGDEFAVVIDRMASDDPALWRLAAGLLAALCEPIELDDGRLARVGASIGVATAPRHGHELAELMAAADAAMYEVKRTGKNACAMAWAATAGNTRLPS